MQLQSESKVNLQQKTVGPSSTELWVPVEEGVHSPHLEQSSSFIYEDVRPPSFLNAPMPPSLMRRSQRAPATITRPRDKVPKDELTLTLGEVRGSTDCKLGIHVKAEMGSGSCAFFEPGLMDMFYLLGLSCYCDQKLEKRLEEDFWQYCSVLK